MGQRLLAVAVVVASACTALHYSTATQEIVAVNPSAWTYNGGGVQQFMVTPATPTDDDSLLSVVLSGCSSQWTLQLNMNDILPTRICGGLGSGSMMAVADNGTSLCPHTYTFSVMFAGTQAGSSSCDVNLTSMQFNSGSGSNQTTVKLTGNGSGGSGITVTPMTVDFQDVQINTTSSPTPVMVKNNSNTSTATVNMSLMGGPIFAVSPSITPFGIGPGSSRFIDVTCTPQLQQDYMGSIQFSDGLSAHVVTLDCTGINSTVTVMPTLVNFASTLVGRPPPNKSVHISGNVTAHIDTVSLDAAATSAGVTLVSNPEGMIIGSGQDVVLAYSAATMHESGPLGALAIKFDIDAMPRTVGINGEALLAGVGTNPVSVDFGAVCAGSTAMKDIEVFADEAGNVMLDMLVKPAPPFEASEVTSLPRMLGGNHSGPSAMVNAKFKPTAPGDFKDAIALKSDVPNMDTEEVQLHGIGLAAGIAATPDQVHFGTAPTGATTSIKEVQFTNCGSSDLMFNSVSINGDNAAEFILIGTNAPRKLKPTESEVFMVAMQPDTGGYKSAKLVIAHDMGSTTADLDGTGEGGGGKERETYYACSTGRGGALWPILIALLALRRRRR